MVALVELAEPHYKGKKNRVAISGLIEGLSRMMRKYQVRFLWELRSVMSAAYQADMAPHRTRRNRMSAEHSFQSNQGAVAKMGNGQSVWVAHKARGQSWA